jgi:predicted membrane-bound mannosyltransferase
MLSHMETNDAVSCTITLFYYSRFKRRSLLEVFVDFFKCGHPILQGTFVATASMR